VKACFVASVMLSISRDRDETHPDHLLVYILYHAVGLEQQNSARRRRLFLGWVEHDAQLKEFQRPLFWDPNILRVV